MTVARQNKIHTYRTKGNFVIWSITKLYKHRQ